MSTMLLESYWFGFVCLLGMYIFSFLPLYSPRGTYEVWFSQEGKNIILFCEIFILHCPQVLCLLIFWNISPAIFCDSRNDNGEMGKRLDTLSLMNMIYWNYLIWCFFITQVNELSIFQASEKYCIRMPNKWNFSFDYFCAAVVVLGIYVPGMSSTSFSPLICALTNIPFVNLVIFCFAS